MFFPLASWQVLGITGCLGCTAPTELIKSCTTLKIAEETSHDHDELK